MGLETTTTIAGLVATNPLDADMISSGDDHLRLIKAVLKATFPGVGAAGFATPITVFEAQLNKLAPFVDNIAALKAQPKLGQKVVATLGYWAIRDGGHGVYWLDSADTTSVDDGGTIIVATDGGRWKLVHDYVVDVAQFGACTGSDDLTFIINAINWAATISEGTVASNTTTVKLTQYQKCYVSNTITYASTSRVDFDWTGGLEAASWVGASTDPILILRNHQSVINLARIDCKSVCCGVEMRNYRCIVNGGYITHFTDWGWHQPAGVGGAWEINGLRVTQWTQTEAEFLDRPTNFTGKGAWIEGSDAHYNGCSFSWSLYPLYIDDSAISNSFNNIHCYQGSAGVGPAPADTIILNNTSNANFFYDCYFDNGYIDYYKYGMVIQGGMFIKNAQASITQPWIRVYNAVDATSPLRLRISNLRASVGFFNGAPGVGTFPGDFSIINAVDTAALLGNGTYVKRQDVIICPNNGTLPIERFLKPIDDIVFTYQVGASTEQSLAYSSTEEKHTTPLFRVINPAGVPHTIEFGGGTVGIAESTNGVLALNNGSGNKWNVASGAAGSLVPAADVSSDVGSNALGVRNFIGKNIRLSPSTSETISQNGQIAFEWVDDTHFKIKQRGSDGVTRSVTLTTA